MARAVTKSGFTMVYDVLAARMDLGSTAKWVLSYMERKAQNRTVKVGLRTLGLLGGKSFQQMSCAVLELEHAGEIQIMRGRPGQRWSYRLLKASAMPTVPQTKSVRHTDGASAMPTEASAMPTRMIQRPSESKKNPPTPQGGRESLSSGNETEEKKKSRKAVASPELRAAVVALFWGSIVPDTQLRYFERHLNDLAQLSATPAEIRRRHKHWPEKFPDATCTLRSLVRHWGVLYREPYEWEKEKSDGHE